MVRIGYEYEAMKATDLKKTSKAVQEIQPYPKHYNLPSKASTASALSSIKLVGPLSPGKR